MERDLFYNFGKFIYTARWYIVLLWVIIFVACIPFLPKLIEPFKSIGFIDPSSESAHADKILNQQLGYGYHRFIIMYRSDHLLATDPEFQQEIKTSLAGLEHFPTKNKIIYPSENPRQISKDNHTAYAAILFESNQEVDERLLIQFKSALQKPAHLIMDVGGEPIFLDDTKKQTQTDLFRAEYIGTPVAIVTMLMVFGSVVAASLPIILGVLTALFILIVLFLLGHLLTLSIFTINIALLLGLCLSLDYALFIISRFRDEVRAGQPIAEATAITQATAGKAIFFSGLAVFASLSALTLFPINVLFSVGIGGLSAVLVSVAIAIVLLPAILAILGPRIDWLKIQFSKAPPSLRHSHWHWLATKVVTRPFIFFFTILVLLLFLAYPFTGIKVGVSDFRILPKHLQSRQVFDTFKEKFGENELAPIMIVIKSSGGTILSAKNISQLYKFTHQLKNDSRVDKISSIVTLDPKLPETQYETMYENTNQLSESLKDFLKLTTKNDLTLVTVTSNYPNDSPETKALIQKIRQTQLGNGMSLQVTGNSVNTIDVFHSIAHVFPYALLWIIGFTYLILLILLRSIFLPLKAIVMTMLSLSASYGVLVFVIQHGFLHQLLHFEPQGMIDINLLIIIFCALFGISMDYEVFLLSRIKEAYEETGDNVKSIVYGIDHSSKIITSAAIIVIVICFAFMFADILIVKAFGLGIAVAAFVDAFLIRSILVPATMTFMKSWNWYCPKWLDRILPKVSFKK